MHRTGSATWARPRGVPWLPGAMTSKTVTRLRSAPTQGVFSGGLTSGVAGLGGGAAATCGDVRSPDAAASGLASGGGATTPVAGNGDLPGCGVATAVRVAAGASEVDAEGRGLGTAGAVAAAGNPASCGPRGGAR